MSKPYKLVYSRPRESEPNGGLVIWERQEYRFEAENWDEACVEKDRFLQEAPLKIGNAICYRAPVTFDEVQPLAGPTPMLPEFAATLDPDNYRLDE